MTKESINEDLRLFSKLTAAATHDLNNVLAIVQETTGLLGDISEMAEPGKGVSPETINKTVESIRNQLRNGQSVLTSLNALSHYSDVESGERDLQRIIRQTLVLNQRAVKHKSLHTTFIPFEGEIIRTVSPFLFSKLICLTLQYFISRMSADDTLTIQLRQVDSSLYLSFQDSTDDEVLPERSIYDDEALLSDIKSTVDLLKTIHITTLTVHIIRFQIV